MKAEHRKELQTNVLADRLGKLYEGLKTGPQSTSTTVWVLSGLVVVVAVAWYFFRQTTPLPWPELQTMDNQKLTAMAETYRGTPLARAARFQKARDLLARGQSTLAGDPEDALNKLAEASSLYEELAADCTNDPILREEALLGVATAEENRGNLARAVEFYQKLAKDAPNSPWGKTAAAKAEQLSNEDRAGKGPELEFYREFAAELAKRGRR